MAVGDSMDASKTWPNACSMNNMVDNLGDCGCWQTSVDLDAYMVDVSNPSAQYNLETRTAFGDGRWAALGFCFTRRSCRYRE